MAGTLESVRILEFGSLGPAPFCGMMLADQGAEVILIERPNSTEGGRAAKNILNRSRQHLFMDLREPANVEAIKRLAKTVDGVIEGYRPGVMERLGLGPDVLQAINPALVYGRMTGWGQEGPLSSKAGHDINYIALAGVLELCGRSGQAPTPPINMLGDFGGGGMLLAFGMLAGILSARKDGKGEIIDCAMTDGAALLSAMVWTHRAQGRWPGGRGENLLDTGAPFYECYETLDDGYVAFGAIEPQFYAEFLSGLGIADDPEFADQHDRLAWPRRKERIAKIVRGKTRSEWEEIFADREACFAPVLSLDEAVLHPQNTSRNVFCEADQICQPAPAPRFRVKGSRAPKMPRPDVAGCEDLFRSLGYEQHEIEALRRQGVFGLAEEVSVGL